MTSIDSAASAARYQKHCPGCFQLKGGAAVCPHCGYDEATPRSPLFLPHGMILGGQYRVGRVLGRPGGFGITYLGWDVNLQQRVAIKEYLPRELAARTQDNLEVSAHTAEDRRGFEFGKEQFLREARIVAKLDHPNIVRVRNFFNAYSTAYLVMDYYEGMTLGDYLTSVRTRLEPALAIPLIKPVLDGLQYVHERGLVHRDLKPHNIYLAAVGRPIVLDFGAARQAAGDRVQSLSVVLTEGYAPLEQYQRRAIQGPWTDVYGAAATLFRMLTGHAPPIALDRIGQDPMESGGWAGIPEALIPALRQALAVRPNERYQSAAEFRTALEQYQTGGDVPAASRPVPEPDPASRPRSRTLPPMTPEPPRSAAATTEPLSAPTSPGSSLPPDPPPPVVLRATPAPVAPATPSLGPLPAEALAAELGPADGLRPASGYPLLGRSELADGPSRAPTSKPATPAVIPARAAGPVPLAPLDSVSAPTHRRPPDPTPSLLASPALPPRRRAEDRPASRLQNRLLLGALLLAASLAVVYVLLNPPGSGPVGPVPSVAAAAPVNAVSTPPLTAPADALAEPALPERLGPLRPPELVALPAGELPTSGGGAPLSLRPFRIGASEVTVGQFTDFVRRSGYRNPRWPNYPCESAGGRLPEWDAPGYAQTDDFPVVCTSLADALAYSDWLSRETGLRFRLPTEAEWEYAARAGSRGRYWWGNEYVEGMASCQSCPPLVPTKPSTVRSFAANPFGLFEMLGNVREWTCSSYLATGGPSNRCAAASESGRVVVRGGSWQEGVETLDAGARSGFEPYRRNVWTGFRVVQE